MKNLKVLKILKKYFWIFFTNSKILEKYLNDNEENINYLKSNYLKADNNRHYYLNEEIKKNIYDILKTYNNRYNLIKK